MPSSPKRGVTILAVGDCRGDLGKDAKPVAPDYETLLVGDAGRLKRELTVEANRCRDQIAATLLLAPYSEPPAPEVI